MVAALTVESKNGLTEIVYLTFHVITLPPNVTSRHQPMDQGIIEWTKNKYKYDLIWDHLEIYYDEGGGTEAIASTRRKEYDGFSQSFWEHVHDDITRMDRIWNTDSEEVIVKCFKKANCMPIVVNK